MARFVRRCRSFDPVYANLHHWHHMIFVQTKWQSWWQVPFRHWTPKNAKCPELSSSSKMNPQSKFDPRPPSNAWKLYAFVQFALMLAGAGLYLVDTSSPQEISAYALPGVSEGVAVAIVAAVVVIAALWSLSNVSSIMTLGVKGTVSSRKTIMVGEVAR